MTPAPMHSTNATAHFRGLDDKLGASLSRSWSTHQPKALKLVAPGSNLPRSALPNQSQFNVTIQPRYPIPLSVGLVGHGNGESIRGDNITDEG
jgi:hypothetical protein